MRRNTGCLECPCPSGYRNRSDPGGGFENPIPRRIKSFSRFVFHINNGMINNLSRSNFAFHNIAHHAEIIPILPDFDDQIILFDTHRISNMIQQGERAMEQQIPYLRCLFSEKRTG